MTRNRAPAQCAACGADIPPRAHACPECGADERTGWREQSIYDGLDLPDSEEKPAQPSRVGPIFWWITGVVVLLIVIALALFRRL